MLDTVALMLPSHQYHIRKPDRFLPHAFSLANPAFAGGLVKATYNPTHAEKRGGYKPRLTLYRRPTGKAVSIYLKIEFSAPKLVFGNNFEELSSIDDLEKMLDALHKALTDMGLDVKRETLRTAPVIAIHYSKNILLDRTLPCFLLIQTLEKLDLTKKLDLTQTDFRNAGQMVKYHASSYEIALYDKVKDLEQAVTYGPKRGAETDYACQTDMLNWRDKPEVLRFEVRLTGKKLKPLLQTLKANRTNTLVDLFCPTLSKTVLLHFWDRITDGMYAMTIDTKDMGALAHSIRATFPKMRPGRVAELIGYLTVCQQIGLRGAALAMGLKQHQLARFKADLKVLDKQGSRSRHSVLNGVKEELRLFYPLTKKDLCNEGLLTHAA
ncbi:MAG: hypothetical protein GC136_11285 [Alphaproteobacteria bacterium]|nr:hypothetical protein [Alphaproteobacteria bacterium]